MSTMVLTLSIKMRIPVSCLLRFVTFAQAIPRVGGFSNMQCFTKGALNYADNITVSTSSFCFILTKEEVV